MPDRPSHPPRPNTGPLSQRWDRSVGELVSLPDPVLSEELKERHRIYCRLVMSLVAAYWNGNKRGQAGVYPWRIEQRLDNGSYRGGDYIGHNIAAIAVDQRGEIIDFDFNHNELFDSSVEHAEARLIRRVFSLSQIYDNWRTSVSSSASDTYATRLDKVTIYTSLESCSQCSGIMALGSVKAVVFVQRDPGQNSIGNILRNLSPDGGRYRPPLPIPGDTVELDEFGRLAIGYESFAGAVGSRQFFVPGDGTAPDVSPSITSFLCTDAALKIFHDASRAFAEMALAYPKFVPSVVAPGQLLPLTNLQVIEHARQFLDYARMRGHRGTAH
jgi:tRNA(Arg) A34 adenosine deaminase TadA